MLGIVPAPVATGRGEPSDAEWARLEPLLPPRAVTCRPRKDRRTILDAPLWLARIGAPWRDLPERFGRGAALSCGCIAGAERGFGRAS